ncbi:uncharacterized protein L3040_008962 [Drepanopeziza brunnea f. sp. 'multigermtubi']|uniref:uncharacterized protein n=1 Tax=Drepanopeziza brunnea f. sp. 'multigermtubi' TaxID=698441 RepID=UPI0023A001E4|nr:hypothetical protein L3040_008962 [Drepanopeziza brunnea f. sp. 'multigermtubi']
MPKARVGSSFALECRICPNDPVFSDVSHLLTHVSSKSHLSHIFKLTIRSSKEPDCKKKLEDYDVWYNQNHLGNLLADRLEAKDQKKSKKKRGSNSSTATTASSAAAAPKQKLKPQERKTTKRGKKKEEDATPELANEVLAQTPVFRAPVPRMHEWEDEGGAISPAADGNFEVSVYATPTARRQVPNFTRQRNASTGKVDPNLNTPTRINGMVDDEYEEYTEEARKPGEKLTDSATLKGVVWDGMGIFDSATPEMKRMRNQRKDRAVLDEMKATSLSIEPDEVSFHPNGEFRASRDIFGPPSAESSPVARSPPSPRKRKTRKVANTLSDMSVNAPRIRAPRAAKNANRSPQKRPMPTTQSRPNVFLQPAPVLNPLAYDRRYMPRGEPFAPTLDEEEEFRSTVAELNGSKKRGFNIFNDGFPEISPGRTETPLEDHRFDFPSSHGLTSYHSNSMTSAHGLASPTPVSKPTSHRAQGKENGQLEMSSHHHNRRALSDSQLYPTHVFYDSASNPLFNQTHTRFSGFGANNFHSYVGSYSGYGEQRSPGGFGSQFLGDYNKHQNPMSYLEQNQNSGMGNSNVSSGHNGGIDFGM